MPEIHVTDSNGVTTTHAYTAPANLMQLLTAANYPEIEALCGGSCSCATCHIWLSDPQHASADFPEKESNEADILELVDDYDLERSRLSCQLTLEVQHSGLHITLLRSGF